MPATEQDLAGMRMADVRKVEYFDFPDDPRFLGKNHVVNFIMQKYEYGGYVKASLKEFFIANSGQANLYSKFQYKRMTYDVAVGAYYRNGEHDFTNSRETFRLPQPDGSVKEFDRYSVTDKASTRRRYFWPTFRAIYSTDKISMINSIGANLDNFPKENSFGSVSYVPEDFPRTDFSNEGNHRENYVTYSGYWNFFLPHGNIINFLPYYSYSRNKQHSRYVETGYPEYYNSASDNSNKISGNLSYQHKFGKWGDLYVTLQGIYTRSTTRYSGTTDAVNKLMTLRTGPGVTYSYSSDNFYGTVGVGFTYDRSKMDDIIEKNTQPWIDFSVQYSFKDRNSFNVDFHHSSGMPPLSFRSSAVIRSNPLMSYTGNPNLSPNKNYDVRLSYQWFPDNRFTFGLFGYAYTATNRYAYVYEATPEGILRTVQQPMGNYAQGNYGLQGTARLLGGNLQLSGQISHTIVRSGKPYNWTKSNIYWYVVGYYYLGQWNFGLMYQSPHTSPGGFVTGTWTKEKDAYSAVIGWGNSSWSVQAQFVNLFRWNWRSESTVFTSNNYDLRQTVCNPDKHSFIFVSATYTFGFGKKIQPNNEASQMSGAGNAILK